MRFNSKFYTQGRFVSRLYRGTADTDNPYLYAKGRYKTKIQESDLPDSYIKCNPRTCNYLISWIQTKGVKYLHASASFLNHWAKDDYLYISYDKPIGFIHDRWYEYPTGYDVLVCGSEIDRIVLAIAKNSPDAEGLVQFVQSRLEKIAYLQREHPECLPTGNYFAEIIKGYSDILATNLAKPSQCPYY